MASWRHLWNSFILFYFLPNDLYSSLSQLVHTHTEGKAFGVSYVCWLLSDAFLSNCARLQKNMVVSIHHSDTSSARFEIIVVYNL